MTHELKLIPRSHWPTRPAWTVVASREEFGGDRLLLSMSAQHGVRLRAEGEGRAASADLSGYRVVKPGDLVVNRLSARDGAYGVSRWEGLVSPAYWVLRAAPGMDSRWLDYVLRSSPYAAELARISKFMPPAQFDLPWDQFRRLQIPMPPLDEQRAIADYLDAETARIDALIEKKERMVELLEERIDAEIREWIGRSPLGGQNSIGLEPVRRLLAKQERWTTSSGEMITAFRDGEVTTRTARGREGFTNSWVDEVRVQIVEEGDVVIHGLDGFSGAIGDSQNHGVCSPVYHVCTAPEGDTAFVGRLLRVLAVNGYLGGFATSTRERAVDFRNWDLFGRIPIPMVPAAVQMRLGDAIRSVRPLRKKINASEALANERRQALITAAVTGEFDIEGAAV